MQRVTMEIRGMSCGHCLNAVKQAIQSVPGVQIENLTIGQAVVSYPDGVITEADIKEAIDDAGYEAVAVP